MNTSVNYYRSQISYVSGRNLYERERGEEAIRSVKYVIKQNVVRYVFCHEVKCPIVDTTG